MLHGCRGRVHQGTPGKQIRVGSRIQVQLEKDGGTSTGQSLSWRNGSVAYIHQELYKYRATQVRSYFNWPFLRRTGNYRLRPSLSLLPCQIFYLFIDLFISFLLFSVFTYEVPTMGLHEWTVSSSFGIHAFCGLTYMSLSLPCRVRSAAANYLRDRDLREFFRLCRVGLSTLSELHQ